MKIFVTGGSGLIGSACIRHLLTQGHSIRALARSSVSADKVSALGATPVHGSVTDASLLEEEARHADAALYCAYDHHSPEERSEKAKIEANGVKAVYRGLERSNKLFIYCSGVAFFGPDDNADESTPIKKSFRGATDDAAERWAAKGVRPVQLRVGIVVHDHTAPHSFVQALHQKDHIAYALDGQNLWPTGHTDDVALLVGKILAQEDKIPKGKVSAVHAYTEQTSTKELAEALGKHTGLPVRSIGAAELKDKGPFMEFVLTASPGVKNTWTKETFGWDPKGNTLVEDMKKGDWFLSEDKSG